MCQTFQSLPQPGGLFDQDSLLVYLMQHVLAAQHEQIKLEKIAEKEMR